MTLLPRFHHSLKDGVVLFQRLQANWRVIRDEGMAQLNSETGTFVPEEENLRETGDWKQLTLFQRGRFCFLRSIYKTVSICFRIESHVVGFLVFYRHER